MSRRQTSMTVAALAGVFGAMACALVISPEAGSTRVTIVMRGAVVLLASSVAAIVLMLRPPRELVVWALCSAGCAIALAIVLGGAGYTPSGLGGMAPSEALGPLPAILALVQVGGFIVATFSPTAKTTGTTPEA